MKTKKAQMQQVFTYIMAILIIGTILILGLRAITNITDKACDVDEVTFKKDLEETISKNSNLGMVGYENIKVPCNYDKLHFINSTGMNCEGIDNDIIKTECETETGNNVFITQGKITTPLFSIENLVVGPEIVELEPRGGQYYMKLEGIGKRQVKISKDDS